MIHKLGIRSMIAALVIITSIVVAVVIGTESATGVRTSGEPASAPQTSVSAPALPACEHEDGSTQRACYWDAQRQSNGQGWSMINMDYGQQTIIVSWLPAPCKAVSQLPGYELPANDHDAIRGLVSGTEMISMLREARVSEKIMAAECTAYLYQWAEDHDKAV